MDNLCEISADTGLYGSNLARWPRNVVTNDRHCGRVPRVKSRRLFSVEEQRIATASFFVDLPRASATKKTKTYWSAYEH
jgi:hypothetical protein